MGKRKSSIPHHSSKEKRQQQTWNMQDMFTRQSTSNQCNDTSIAAPSNESTERDSCLRASTSDNLKNRQTYERIEDVNASSTSGCRNEFEHEFAIALHYSSNTELILASLCPLASFRITLDCTTPDDISKTVAENEVTKFPHSFSAKMTSNCEYCVNCDNQHMIRVVSTYDSPCPYEYHTAHTEFPDVCLACLRQRQFIAVVYNIDITTSELSVYLCLWNSFLSMLSYPCEAPRPLGYHLSIQMLMEILYGISVPRTITTSPVIKKLKKTSNSVTELFDYVRCHHHIPNRCGDPVTDENNIDDDTIQHPDLSPVLRPYQKASVRWMLQREMYSQKHTDQVEDRESSLHPLYSAINLPVSQLLYYNKHIGSLVRERPVLPACLPGGILADEMGLGKTVEVLTCMLLHPRTDLPPLGVMSVAKYSRIKNLSSDDDDEEMDEKTILPEKDNLRQYKKITNVDVTIEAVVNNVSSMMDGTAGICQEMDKNVSSEDDESEEKQIWKKTGRFRQSQKLHNLDAVIEAVVNNISATTDESPGIFPIVKSEKASDDDSVDTVIFGFEQTTGSNADDDKESCDINNTLSDTKSGCAVTEGCTSCNSAINNRVCASVDQNHLHFDMSHVCCDVTPHTPKDCIERADTNGLTESQIVSGPGDVDVAGVNIIMDVDEETYVLLNGGTYTYVPPAYPQSDHNYIIPLLRRPQQTTCLSIEKGNLSEINSQNCDTDIILKSSDCVKQKTDTSDLTIAESRKSKKKKVPTATLR